MDYPSTLTIVFAFFKKIFRTKYNSLENFLEPQIRIQRSLQQKQKFWMEVKRLIDY